MNWKFKRKFSHTTREGNFSIANNFLGKSFGLQTLKNQADFNLLFDSYFTCKNFVWGFLSALYLYFVYKEIELSFAFFTLCLKTEVSQNWVKPPAE